MFKELQETWERDRLGMLAALCAVIAGALVALPAEVRWERTYEVLRTMTIDGNFVTQPMLTTESGYKSVWFSTERLPAAGVAALASVTISLLRRR